MGQPLAGVADPRWVLAVRVAETMQGAMLPVDARQRLVRLGKVMGLSPFDANLVIAIVQDQARRGYAPAFCPTAGQQQLTMVPLPGTPKAGSLTDRARFMNLASLILAVVLTELAILWWLFAGG